MAGYSDINAIFEKYKDRVYRLALSIGRNERDAEDILQNTFLKIIENIPGLKRKEYLSTWIYRIAYNEALAVLRKKKGQYRLSEGLKAAGVPSGFFVNWPELPDGQLLEKELKEKIDSAIRRLPIKYRMALLLNNVERLSLKESAKILNLKLNSLKTRLLRARLLLRAEILDYFQDKQARARQEEQSCGALTGFVDNYSDGRLPKVKKDAFGRHIEDCPGCRLFLRRYQAAIRITGSLQCQDLPGELKDRIRKFLLKSKKH